MTVDIHMPAHTHKHSQLLQHSANPYYSKRKVLKLMIQKYHMVLLIFRESRCDLDDERLEVWSHVHTRIAHMIASETIYSK